MRTCENCKHSEPIMGGLACMGQKGMPFVRPTDSCEDWKTMKQTNADRLRAMTDEELAKFMFTANGCPMWVSEYSCKEDKGCAGAKGACWLDWLKQERGDEST